ncbi:MAG TPA: BamA/TamA family outer membrane protein [Vicinamibacterales bacterium]
MPSTLRRSGSAAAVALLVLSAADGVTAQQFGRNQVRHRTFEFRVLRTEHFAIHYYEDAPDAVRMAGRLAERWHTRLSDVLAHDLRGEQPLILYAAPGHFQQTNVTDAEIGEGVGGFAESLRRRIVMPFVGDLAETDHVLGHEIVHAFQFDMIGPRWPLWFMEGMAEYLSLGSVDAHTAVWLRDAALADRLPAIADLDDPRFFPYRYGHALFAYIGQRYGDRAIPAIMRHLGAPALRPLEDAPVRPRNASGEIERAGDPIRAIELALGVDRQTLTREWHESIRATMLPRVEGHTAEPGEQLIEPRTESEMNVGPVLSPDGSRVAFLTSRNRLSIDLVVADTSTGEILRTLLRTAGDAHLDSLQFIRSAGTWDPSGRRVAMAVVRRGRPVLAIVDAETGRRERDIPLRDVDEAIQPSWSPDGTSIAFSGLRNGLSDLYLVSVEDGAIRRLTDDPFAERQPAWSPDGRSLLFVTDRFSSSLDTLAIGAHRIARIDVNTRAIDPLGGFPGARHGSPQWSDGGIYFVANPDGVPDVYRLDPATERMTRITRSSTGVTGITASSPALSVARTVSRLAFSVHRDTYEIRQLDDRGPADARVPAETTLAAARLAPASRLTSVDRLLADATRGLPDGPLPESERFRPRLGLEFVGQEFSASTGGTGPFLSGGIALLFSDMLRNHIVEAMVQTNNEFRDTGGRIGYLNRSRRWNWGAFVQHVPAVTGGVARAITEIDGQQVFVEQEVRDRQLGQQVQGILEFPISRSQRFEFGTGVSHFTFNRRVRTSLFSGSGSLITENEERVELSDPLTLWQSAVAFVTDSTVFGATGPLLGARSRFEVSPTYGDADYTSLVLDARRYVMPVEPVTIAGRLLHVGRYGGDADSGRLSPLFVGFPTFVRGYDVYSFDPHDCDPGACIQLDDLEGSRLLVANVEVRTPLVGLFRGRLDYGAVPVDLIGFFDAGVAWRGDDSLPSASFGDRPWVKSAGVGVRLNAFGFAVVELSAVHAFNRPRDKWHFLFALQPGF